MYKEEEENSIGPTDQSNIFPEKQSQQQQQSQEPLSKQTSLNIIMQQQHQSLAGKFMNKRKNLALFKPLPQKQQQQQQQQKIKAKMTPINDHKKTLNLFQTKQNQDKNDTFEANYQKYLQKKETADPKDLETLEKNNIFNSNSTINNEENSEKPQNNSQIPHSNILQSDNSYLNQLTNSNSHSYSMHLNLINANCQMKVVKQKSENINTNNLNLTSFANVNQFIKGNNQIPSKKNIFSINQLPLSTSSLEKQKENEEDIENEEEDQKMQIEDSNQQQHQQQQQQQNQQDIQNKQFEFSMIENITLYSNQSLEWFQTLFSQNIAQKSIGKYSEYFEKHNFKQKVQQSIKYYRKEISFFPNFSKEELLQQQNQQSNIIDTFISVFQQFEQDKQKFFQVIENKPNINTSNSQILFKWVKIRRDSNQNNSSNAMSFQKPQDQYQYFFNSNHHNNNQNHKHPHSHPHHHHDYYYSPVAILSSYHRNYADKLKDWGIKFTNLKDTLSDNDHEKEHRNFKKYGQIHEKDIEVIIVKEKYLNNLWMRIMSEIFDRKISLEIISTYDFENSQVCYLQSYYCGEVFSNNIQYHQNIFQQQQQQQQFGGGQGGLLRNMKVEQQQNLGIFSHLNQKRQQNMLFTLKFFGNVPNYILRQLVHCLQDAGIQINLQLSRYELSNYFALDTITHLLDAYYNQQ